MMTDAEIVEMARIKAQSYRTGGGDFSIADERTFIHAFEILYGIAMMGLPNTALIDSDVCGDGDRSCAECGKCTIYGHYNRCSEKNKTNG